MFQFDRRIAADMVREYELSIAYIDGRISELLKQVRKLKPHTVPWVELNQRINALEIDRGDLAWAIHKIKPYVKGEEG